MEAIRHATAADLPAVYRLIQELADYENAPDAVSLTLEQFIQDFKQQQPPFHVLIAEAENHVAGMALYFFTYSTWRGRCLYLEDMIVTQSWRQRGLGKALFEQLLTIGAKAEVARMAWQVLDWNRPAIHFYQRYGAWLEAEWLSGKLTGDQIKARQSQFSTNS